MLAELIELVYRIWEGDSETRKSGTIGESEYSKRSGKRIAWIFGGILTLLLAIGVCLSLLGCEDSLQKEYKREMDKSGEEKVLESELKAAHKASIFHKEAVLKSENCGCFHCLATFPPSSIEHWTDKSKPDAEHTALCPECGIDSVLHSESGYPITSRFLAAMKAHWF